MGKAYVVMAIATGLMLLILLAVLLPWWMALILITAAAWLFWQEVTPILRHWRPERRGGWQRNALRWTRRDLPPDYPARERRE